MSKLVNDLLSLAGQVDELTGPLLLLAGWGGSFINGAVIPVDGGHLASSL